MADQLHLVERLVQVIGCAWWIFSRTTIGPSPCTSIGPSSRRRRTVVRRRPTRRGWPARRARSRPSPAPRWRPRPRRGVFAPWCTSPPVVRPGAAGLQLGDGEVERGVAVLRRGLGPDHRPARVDRELDAARAELGQARVVLLGHFDVDADHLGVEPLDLASFSATCSRKRSGTSVWRPLTTMSTWPPSRSSISLPVPSLRDHAPSVPGHVPVSGRAPARPTWSSTPHPPAEGLAALAATTPLLPGTEAIGTSGGAGLTSKPHRDRTTRSRLTWAVSPAAGIGLPEPACPATGDRSDATTDPGGCHDETLVGPGRVV